MGRDGETPGERTGERTGESRGTARGAIRGPCRFARGNDASLEEVAPRRRSNRCGMRGCPTSPDIGTGCSSITRDRNRKPSPGVGARATRAHDAFRRRHGWPVDHTAPSETLESPCPRPAFRRLKTSGTHATGRSRARVRKIGVESRVASWTCTVTRRGCPMFERSEDVGTGGVTITRPSNGLREAPCPRLAFRRLKTSGTHASGKRRAARWCTSRPVPPKHQRKPPQRRPLKTRQRPSGDGRCVFVSLAFARGLVRPRRRRRSYSSSRSRRGRRRSSGPRSRSARASCDSGGRPRAAGR